ncbi:MAG: alkaline phosphatase [Bacteroidales bacterium]|nr:alkaline phosphatase [Bacteroidales bacterium]
MYKNLKSNIFIILLVLVWFNVSCQNNTKEPEPAKPKNIILMIGDGMGISHIYAAMVVNGNKLNIERCPYSGFSKTYSANSFNTDSGAAGTAIATGKKTNNRVIGVDSTEMPLKSILEYAEDHNLSTGLVATSEITHATPASFIAHQPSRYLYEEIASDFLKTDIEVFIGGGLKHFNDRKDGEDLTLTLKEKGYHLIYDLNELEKINEGKIAGLLYKKEPPGYSDGRGDMLEIASEKAVEILSKNTEGFFLMIEGSQIDWEAHKNNTEFIVEEVLDFDRTVGKMLDFAEKNGETLVIITADHETGGMAVNNGDFDKKNIDAHYTSRDHTGIPVPVFTFGPDASAYSGIYENTDLFYKMMKSFEFEPDK